VLIYAKEIASYFYPDPACRISKSAVLIDAEEVLLLRH
jgi:hypothetical protein